MSLLPRIATILRRHHDRRASICSLRALPDDVLVDIGIPPDRIEETVAGLLDAPPNRPAALRKAPRADAGHRRAYAG